MEEGVQMVNVLEPRAEVLQTGAKRRVAVGPWKTVAEFHRVCELLFGENATDNTRKEALDEMRVWHIRRSNLCPAMVLATSALLEVQLKEFANKKSGRLSNSELCMLYACSITRFFNFVSSTLQKHKMRTMYDIARELKIETFIVDVRHICAHSEVLPPLEQLRKSVIYSINWLRDHYWLPQSATMRAVDLGRIRYRNQMFLVKRLQKYCAIYDSAYECVIAGVFKTKAIKNRFSGKRLSELIAYMRENDVKTVHNLFTPLVLDLIDLATVHRSIKDIADIFADALLKMTAFYTAVDNSSSDHDIQLAISVNQELFRMLAKQDIIETYFARLMQMAEGYAGKTDCRAGASFWAHQILKGYTALCVFRQHQKEIADAGKPNLWDKPVVYISLDYSLPKSLRKALIYAGVDFERTLFFPIVSRRPWIWAVELVYFKRRLDLVNEFTAHIVKGLLDIVDPALSEDEMEQCRQLIEARFAIAIQEDPKQDVSHTVYTADDLPSHVYTEAGGCSPIWTTTDDGRDWSSCALGLLPKK